MERLPREKEKEKLEKDYEFSKETTKKEKKNRKYQLWDDELFNWYGKDCRTNVYPDGTKLQEEGDGNKEKG